MATEPEISSRAKAIAAGLVRTKRAKPQRGVFEHGLLRLKSVSGGYYWISFNGGRVLRGNELFGAEGAEELQPKFIDAMERAGLRSR